MIALPGSSSGEQVRAARGQEHDRGRAHPLVSVVVNNYNYGRFVAKAIDSVLAQSYPHVELVVVDDGSTDDSRAVIAAYGDRLKAIFKPNGGQGSAINRGFQETRGELVLFLDADDWYYPDAIARVVEAAREGAALVQFRMDMVGPKGEELGAIPSRWVRFDSGDVVPLLLSRGHFVGTVTSGNAFGRGALEAVLPIPEATFRGAADGYLVNTVPFFGKVTSISDALGAYRFHGANVAEYRSATGVDVAGVRKRLEWTTRELALVLRFAQARNLEASDRIAMRYMGHLRWRLVSRMLDPEGHPFPDDVPWKLGAWGALAALRDKALRLRDRAWMFAWFPLVGVLPSGAARSLIDFAMMPGRRRRLLEKAMPWRRSS